MPTMNIRGQLLGVSSFHYVGLADITQVVRLRGKFFNVLSHLSSPEMAWPGKRSLCKHEDLSPVLTAYVKN